MCWRKSGLAPIGLPCLDLMTIAPIAQGSIIAKSALAHPARCIGPAIGCPPCSRREGVKGFRASNRASAMEWRVRVEGVGHRRWHLGLGVRSRCRCRAWRWARGGGCEREKSLREGEYGIGLAGIIWCYTHFYFGSLYQWTVKMERFFTPILYNDQQLITC